MRKSVIHRVLELLLGVPLLLFGGSLISMNIIGYFWVQEDPEHRRMDFSASMIGIIPFLAGCWLILAAFVRLVRRNHPAKETFFPDRSLPKGAHRPLRFIPGAILLLVGGIFLYGDVVMYQWVQQDPIHRRAVYTGTFLGVLPFLLGCWLIVLSVVRWLRQKQQA